MTERGRRTHFVILGMRGGLRRRRMRGRAPTSQPRHPRAEQERSDCADPRIHAGLLPPRSGPILSRTSAAISYAAGLPRRSGVDPRVSATAFGLLRPKMTKPYCHECVSLFQAHFPVHSERLPLPLPILTHHDPKTAPFASIPLHILPRSVRCG